MEHITPTGDTDEVLPLTAPTVLFVNTRARRGAKHFPAAVRALADAGIALVEAVAVDDPETMPARVQAAAAAGHTRIVVGGGDGTLSAVMGTFANRPVTLGVLPLGTGNDLVRTLGIPLDLPGAARVIAAGRVARIDLGRADERYFINTLSMGVSDAVAHAATRRLKRYLGFFAYGVAAARVLPRHKHFRAHLDSPVKVCDATTHQLVVANGTYVGEHLKAGPDAAIDNGRLVVFTLEGRSRYQLIRGAWSVALGRQATDPRNHYFETDRLAITADPPQRVTLDGEPAGETPVTVRVVPRALRVCAPAAYLDRPSGHR